MSVFESLIINPWTILKKLSIIENCQQTKDIPKNLVCLHETFLPKNPISTIEFIFY